MCRDMCMFECLCVCVCLNTCMNGQCMSEFMYVHIRVYAEHI
jgi:hypothetical protein